MGKEEQIYKRQYMRLGMVSFLLALVTIQFVNCQTFEEGELSESLVICIDENDNNCVQPKVELLGLRINSPVDVFVKPYQFKFNVSGDCNEGGFANNMITWKLYVGDSLLSSSEQKNQLFGCTKGSFLLLVELPSEAQQSLIVGGTRVQHSLIVELFGQEGGGRFVTNSSLARKAIYVNPK